MRIFKMTGRKAAFAAVGAIVAAGAGGTAYAATGSANPSVPASSSGPAQAGASPISKPAHPRARTLLQRSDHATLELKVKGQWVTYTLDRGKVASVSPTSITLTRPDGQTVTDTINSGTRFGGVTSASAVELNKPAAVLSEAGTALRVHQGRPPVGTSQTPGSGS